jgi:dTDP-4-dehydrorhamnose reductase
MKILLIGKNGQLGSDLHELFQVQGAVVTGVTHAEFDICNADHVLQVIGSERPHLVVNTAAFHRVEECETKLALSFEVNAIGALHLARACHKYGAVLVHFSTDYVFDGAKNTPYSETDLPVPLNVYGASKVAGELLIAASLQRYLVVRTCGLYGLAGSSGKGGNFVETMLRKAADRSPVRVVHDQVLTPTYTADLARAVAELVRAEAFGLYHVSCEGQCSWYEFARKIFELEQFTVDLVPVTTSEFPSSVRRPPYSVLSKRRLRGHGIVMPTWEDSLARYLKVRTARQQPAVAGRN